ncbi:MAG: hypothetical protein AB4426_19565 [Xenococcaceae cyanobacterium]
MLPQILTISHLPATPYTILRLDYLIICQDDYCAAKILSLFEAWSESKRDAVEQAKYHNKAAAKEGLEPTHDETTWLYNTLENIRQRLLEEYSVKTINKALKTLVDLGFLQTRFNPNHKWDRTKQYQFQTEAVQTAIYQITQEQLERYISPKAETLDFLHLVNLPNASGKNTKSKAQIYQIESADLPNRSGKNTKAIPKSHNKESIKENTPIAAPSPQHPTQSVCVAKNDEKVEKVKAIESSEEEVSQDESFTAQDEKTNSTPLAEVTALDRSSAVSLNNNKTLKSQKRRQLSEFQQWKQQIERIEWEAFINWKSEQAPADIRDRLGWAYNTLKADLERAQLSLSSFRQEKAQSRQPSGSRTKPDGTPNFEAWEMEQHIEVAKQYLANSVAFLREQSWHKDWVEFVNVTFPNLFTEVNQEGLS